MDTLQLHSSLRITDKKPDSWQSSEYFSKFGKEGKLNH